MGKIRRERFTRLMALSAYSALEFGESLRLTLKLNPNNHALEQMASEELKTNNLSFEDYNQRGDHAEFLLHFFNKYGLQRKYPQLKLAGDGYFEQVRSLDEEIRVMSIVSREQELPGIFSRILTAKKWDAEGFPAFRYYLERHISLDSVEGGHADMLKDMPVDDRVVAFYQARLEMYRSLPKLFIN